MLLSLPLPCIATAIAIAVSVSNILSIFFLLYQITTGLKYFELFLPTSSDIPKSKTHALWKDEFMQLWETFGNRSVAGLS
jgi:hypothetical protein